MGVLMSKHEEIIVDFINKNPQYKRYKLRENFIKTLINQEHVNGCTEDEAGKLLSKKDTYKLYSEGIGLFNYIPDAYFIDKKNRTLHILEVDGTSGTSKAKLSRMIDLWWFTDNEAWFLELTSISVHTEAISHIDDAAFYELSIKQIYKNIKKERNQNGYAY